jgi:hypothetical protein
MTFRHTKIGHQGNVSLPSKLYSISGMMNRGYGNGAYDNRGKKAYHSEGKTEGEGGNPGSIG